MEPLILEGDTLGQKHKHYNKYLDDVVNKKVAFELTDINMEDNDVKNLLKIDLANHKKDVSYILKVLKSEDMLYVSRAIKKCTWLITDPQYKHIINPEYLQLHLFPEMRTKANIKLMLQIRLKIKDEEQAQKFYTWIEDKSVENALKWLPKCSVPFIEQKVEKHADLLKLNIFKRLCERSFTVLEIYNKAYNKYENRKKQLELSNFFIHSDMDKYMDIVDLLIDPIHPIFRWKDCPKFGKRTTNYILEKCPQRIMDNFEKYSDSIYMPAFAKYIKNKNVKDFLLKVAEKAKDLSWLKCDKLKILILSIPRNERFDFVKEVFIDKTHIAKIEGNESMPLDAQKVAMNKLYTLVTKDNAENTDSYRWYQFAPFDIAFTELTKMVESEQSYEIKYSMLKLLVTLSLKNPEYTKILLKYYNNKHMEDNLKFKIKFIDHLLSQNNIHKYDQKCWNYLNDIFQSIDVYGKSDENLQNCVTSIIIYKVINDEIVPDTIEPKLNFDNFKVYKNKLNKNQNEKVFIYLREQLTKKIESHTIKNKTDFVDAMNLIILAMKLLMIYEKEFTDYSLLLNKINDYLRIKEENSWDSSLCCIYNFKKTWRRHMFKESILLFPSEAVLLNVLKHGPIMLTRFENVIDSMCCDDKLSLRRFLSKLRIYWTESLATKWISLYRNRLNELNGHVALTRGLFALLAKQQVIEIVEEYAPVVTKIDWDEIDDLTLSLQRQIAKNMHFARPQPHPNLIMPYIKGDYLHYALTSLYAIFYNLSLNQSKKFVPLLWDAPVSLQKHGIRFAFNYMDTAELKCVFCQIWKLFKNRSIRAVIFKLTHKYLCNDKNNGRINDMWQIMESCIKNLNNDEDRTIYETVDKVNKIHISIQPYFLKESYTFLKKLIKCGDKKYESYEKSVENLAKYTEEIMDSVDPDFVVDILNEFIENTFCTERTTDRMTQVISKYVFHGNHKEVQKIEKFIKPLIQSLLNSWNSKPNEEYFVRTNFDELTWHLQCGVYDQIEHRNMPLKVLSFILSELEKLPIHENYILMRKWKLIVILANNYDKQLKTEFENDLDVTREPVEIKAAPEFGEACYEILKEDVKKYFSCIYILFEKALDSLYCRFSKEAQTTICKAMLQDEGFIEGHLLAIKLFPDYCYCEKKRKAKEIHDLLRTHNSLEVRMHYYNRLNNSYLTTALESCENNPAKKKLKDKFSLLTVSETSNICPLFRHC